MSNKKQCNESVENYRMDNGMRVADYGRAIIDLLACSAEASVEATQRDIEGKPLAQQIARILAGGWRSVKFDDSRNYSGALKLSTLVTKSAPISGGGKVRIESGNVLTQLTFSVEMSNGGHFRDWYFQVIPTLTVARFICEACYVPVMERMTGKSVEVLRRDQWTEVSAPSTESGCHFCGSGETVVQVTMTYHVLGLDRSDVARSCGCADMTLRGYAGDVVDMTMHDLVAYLQYLRASIQDASVMELELTKYQTQHDASVTKAYNPYFDRLSARDKATLAELVL